eukprot:1479029-Amphidinium_carterae.1
MGASWSVLKCTLLQTIDEGSCHNGKVPSIHRHHPLLVTKTKGLEQLCGVSPSIFHNMEFTKPTQTCYCEHVGVALALLQGFCYVGSLGVTSVSSLHCAITCILCYGLYQRRWHLGQWQW